MTGEGAEEAPRASSNHDELFLSSVLKNKGNRLPEVRQAFSPRFVLTVGAGHLGAVCDVPWAILLDDH